MGDREINKDERDTEKEIKMRETQIKRDDR